MTTKFQTELVVTAASSHPRSRGIPGQALNVIQIKYKSDT